MMNAENGLMNLPLSPCFRKSTRLFSSHAFKFLSRRAISLSGSPEGDDRDVAGLLNRLNDAMVAYRPGLRDHLKNALIPTVHHQTRLHNILRDKIDTSFATGILSVDQVCKNVEAFRLKDEDDIDNCYSGVKVRIHSDIFPSTWLIPP